MEIKKVYKNEYLFDIDFSNTSLDGVIFRDCTIINVKFNGAILNNIKFIHSKLSNVSFEKAKMRLCSFLTCTLYDAFFVDAVLDNINFTDVEYITRIDFSKSKLRLVNFKFINCPKYAVFENASLDRVCFDWCNLSIARFLGAKLTDVSFSNATLTSSSFVNAQIIDTDFEHANLYESIFSGAELSNSTFRYANLSEAKFNRSILLDCNFTGSNLYNCNLDNTDSYLSEYKKGKILTESIIGYKKCIPCDADRIYNFLDPDCLIQDIDIAIVTLEIPRGAIVFSINGGKCRTNKAKVIDIVDGNGNKMQRAKSYMMGNLTYYIGDEFTIYDFNCEYNVECSAGIHFFMTRKEAEEYKV